MHREQYQKAVNQAYIEALHFTETGPDSDIESECTLSPASVLKCERDCVLFVDQLIENRLFKKALDIMTPEQIGHDFWLTRNGHGAGFWDRDNGELGDKLSAIAHSFGECYAYQGDDNLIHIDGGKQI